MAEVDPMVQTFLKARIQNQREEVKLQKYLAHLEVRKVSTKAILDNQLFEHRKIAFDLKREADLGKTQSKLNAKNEELLDSVFEDSPPLPKPIRQNSNVAFLDAETISNGQNKGTIVTILSSRENVTDERKHEARLEGSSLPRLASVLSFPPVWKTSSAKRRETVDSDDADGSGVAGSGQKLDKVPRTDTSLVKEGVVTCWMGDPVAIGSVRRPRKSTKELNAKEQSRLCVRTAAREMNQFFSCSRQCGKSKFIYELERSFADIPMLLPAIMAERERKAQEANRLRVSSIASLSSRGGGLPELMACPKQKASEGGSARSGEALARSDSIAELDRAEHKPLPRAS